jgi:hypothetical protein
MTTVDVRPAMENAEYREWVMNEIADWVDQAREIVGSMRHVDPAQFEDQYPGAAYAAAFGTLQGKAHYLEVPVQMLTYLLAQARKDEASI